MTQLFDENGNVVAVTAINILPAFVTDVKSEEKHGYNAVQIAAGEGKEKKLSKAELGHTKGVAYEFLKEFRVDNPEEYKLGDKIGLEIFSEGQKLILTSVSKGKGFQGGVKRWGFSGGRRSHGNKHAEREVGSIGAGTTPGRVWKGKKMPGRMGSDRVTIKNLKLVKIDKDNSRIFVKGAVAGKPGALVEIKF